MTPEELQALQKQLAEYKASHDKLNLIEQAAKDKELKDKGQFDQLLTNKLNEQSAQFDKKYSETEKQYQARLAKLDGEFHVLKVKNVVESIVKDKVKDDLSDFVLSDAVTKFKIVDGNPVMLDENNTPVLFEGKPITPAQYINQVLEKKPSLLKESNGSGTPKGTVSKNETFKLDLNDPEALANAYERNPELVKKFMRDQGLSM